MIPISRFSRQNFPIYPGKHNITMDNLKKWVNQLEMTSFNSCMWNYQRVYHFPMEKTTFLGAGEEPSFGIVPVHVRHFLLAGLGGPMGIPEVLNPTGNPLGFYRLTSKMWLKNGKTHGFLQINTKNQWDWDFSMGCRYLMDVNINGIDVNVM